MARYVFDHESNGFLNEATRIHCLAYKDIDTGEAKAFALSEVERGVHDLMQADLLVGHNVIKHDLPLLEKIYPWFHYDEAKVQDTLVLSRLVFADLSDIDGTGDFHKVEPKLTGSHGLKAWGQRIAHNKGDYDGGFDEFSPEMLEYNIRDVEVTARLWRLIQDKAVDPRANELEHKVAFIIARQERHGISFDVPKAQQLTATLMKRRLELEVQTQDTFRPWYKSDGEFIPKKDNKKLGYTAGQPMTKVSLTMFNPNSRHHIADRLMKLYGWQPKEFTPAGQPQIDETVLSKLPYPEAKLLAESFLVQKRLGMVAEGDNAWLRLVKPDGRIHGEIITNGAVTGRATHRNPNMSQVPAVGSPYGSECRELFCVPKGKTQIGIDVSGLELRMLAHFLAAWDKGAYGKVVCEGDPHSVNQAAAGLPTRAAAKTFCYAYLYGGGDVKLGSIVLPTATEAQQRKRGKELKAAFTKRTPGLQQLVSGVQKAAERGYLIGLDGRHIKVRSPHAALNTLLQSGGGLVCKRWMVEMDEETKRRGYQHKVHQILWSHDELGFESDPDIAEEVAEYGVMCIQRAADYFKIRVPLTGEAKLGINWQQCH